AALGEGNVEPGRAFGAGALPGAGAMADLNGDSLLDLAIVNDVSGVSVLLGRGDGTFEAPQSFPAGISPSAIAFGDFNGDGAVDLAVAGSQMAVLMGNRDCTFQSPGTFS